MKKTLLALAALAAVGTVSAQSSVTVFGTLDPSFRAQTITLGNGTSSSQNFLGNNGQGTSQVSFRGVEDLGGGLKATFLVENDFNVTQYGGQVGAAGVVTTALGANGGELYVGIEGGFGRFLLGTPNTPSLSVQANRQPFGTKIGSGFGSVLGKSHVRDSGSMVYYTPNFAGFTVGLAYTSEVNAFQATAANFASSNGTLANANAYTSTAGAAKTDLSLSYANGPLAAGLSFFNQNLVEAQVNGYVSYAFGPAKVTLGMSTTNSNTPVLTTDNSSVNIAADYSMTPTLSLLANFATLDDKLAADADRRVSALGVKYLLSKRTSIYSRYVVESNEKVAATAASEIRTFLVGVQHNF